MIQCNTVCMATLMQQFYYFPLSMYIENRTKTSRDLDLDQMLEINIKSFCIILTLKIVCCIHFPFFY